MIKQRIILICLFILGIYLMLAQGTPLVGKVNALTPADTPNYEIAFTSDRENWPTVYEVNSDGSNLHAIKPPEAEAIAGYPMWSPDGNFVAFSVSYQDNRDSIVYIIDDTSGESYSFSASESTLDAAPSWAPDSKQIAFVSNRDNTHWQIYTTNIFTFRDQHLISDKSSDDYNPVWSPDGEYIAFVRGKDQTAQLFIVGVDGTNPRNLAVTSPAAITWSPTGKTIASTFDHRICTIDIDPVVERCITGFSESFSPAWSPDGKHIAFSGVQVDVATTHPRPNHYDIFVVDADLQNVHRLTFNGNSGGDNFYPAWSPNGLQLAFFGAGDQGISVFAVSVDGASPHEITEATPGKVLCCLAWKP